MAVMALLRSRARPGSQDTSHRCWLPGARRAVCAVWSLVMVVSLMVRVMVRLPGRVRVRGCGRARLRGARPGRAAGRAASRGAGRRRSRTPGGRRPVVRERQVVGFGGFRHVPLSRPRARDEGRSGRAVGWSGPVSGGRASLAGLPVGGGLGPAIWPGLAGAGSGGGLGGLEHAAGHLVEGLGVPEVDLAGGAGLVGAVGAHLGAVALVVGGDIRAANMVMASAWVRVTASWRLGPG